MLKLNDSVLTPVYELLRGLKCCLAVPRYLQGWTRSCCCPPNTPSRGTTSAKKKTFLQTRRGEKRDLVERNGTWCRSGSVVHDYQRKWRENACRRLSLRVSAGPGERTAQSAGPGEERTAQVSGKQLPGHSPSAADLRGPKAPKIRASRRAHAHTRCSSVESCPRARLPDFFRAAQNEMLTNAF